MLLKKWVRANRSLSWWVTAVRTGIPTAASPVLVGTHPNIRRPPWGVGVRTHAPSPPAGWVGEAECQCLPNPRRPRPHSHPSTRPAPPTSPPRRRQAVHPRHNNEAARLDKPAQQL